MLTEGWGGICRRWPIWVPGIQLYQSVGGNSSQQGLLSCIHIQWHIVCYVDIILLPGFRLAHPCATRTGDQSSGRQGWVVLVSISTNLVTTLWCSIVQVLGVQEVSCPLSPTFTLASLGFGDSAMNRLFSTQHWWHNFCQFHQTSYLIGNHWCWCCCTHH